MPRRPRTTAAKNRRHIKSKKPTASNQKKQIASTQNQIVAIKRHLNLVKERCRWHCGFTNVSMTTYPLIIPLTSGPSTNNPAAVNSVIGHSVPWNLTMTPAPQDLNTFRSKVVVNKQYVDLTIQGGNEPSQLQVTAFVVQLQPKVAQQTYTDTSSMQTMIRGTDYITPLDALGVDSGYGAYINNQRYKIIKRLELEIQGPTIGWPGGPPASGDVGRGTRNLAIYRAQFKLNYGSTIMKSSGDNAQSQTLEYSNINPEQKRFIVIFSNNSLVDLEFPQVSLSSLITGYAAE